MAFEPFEICSTRTGGVGRGGVNEHDLLIKEIIHPNLITHPEEKGNITLELILGIFTQLGEHTEITNAVKAPFVSRTGAEGPRSPGVPSRAFNGLSVTSV